MSISEKSSKKRRLRTNVNASHRGKFFTKISAPPGWKTLDANKVHTEFAGSLKATGVKFDEYADEALRKAEAGELRDFPGEI